MVHEWQHPEQPTWCKHCGYFSCYCIPGEPCHGEMDAFNADKKEGHAMISNCIAETFGETPPTRELLLATEQVRSFPTTEEKSC